MFYRRAVRLGGRKYRPDVRIFFWRQARLSGYAAAYSDIFFFIFGLFVFIAFDKADISLVLSKNVSGGGKCRKRFAGLSDDGKKRI